MKAKYKVGDTYTVNEDHTFTEQWKKYDTPSSDNESYKEHSPENMTQGSNSGPSDQKAIVDTGDASNQILWLVLVLLSAVFGVPIDEILVLVLHQVVRSIA